MGKAIMPLKYRHVIHDVFFSVVIVSGVLIEAYLLKEMKDNDSLNQVTTEVQTEIQTETANEEVGEIGEVEKVHILNDSELSQLYSLNPQPINDNCLSLTVDDAQALMKIAVVEDNTDVNSQAEIMLVVLNRVASEDFPDSVIDVIKQDRQFSTVSNGSYKKATPDVNSHLALALVESRQIESDALFFEADYCKGTWQAENRTYLCTVGHTRFYK